MVVEALGLSHSPISQIPNEIIAKIFLEGTVNEIWNDDNVPSGLPFPDLVAEVCHHWRALSHSTPILWTVIHPPSPEVCLTWLSNWLERSKAMPVSILLDEVVWKIKSKLRISEESMITPSAMSQIFVLLECCAHRLHRLDIRMRWIPLEKWSQILSKTTQLQQFSLCRRFSNRSSFNGPSVGDNFAWMQEKPILTRLRFRGLSFPYSTHLTSLEVHGLHLDYTDVEALLGPNSCIKYLILRDLRPTAFNNTTPVLESPIRVNSLQSIVISSSRSYIGPRRVAYLFPLLDMPNITYLQLDSDISFSVMFGKSLSAAKLDTLKIANHLPIAFPYQSVESNEDIQTLQSFSTLRHLELTRITAKLLLDYDQPCNGQAPNRQITRQRSIGSRIRANRPTTQAEHLINGSTMATAWPELRSILLDTAIAEDVVSVIKFIQHHKNIQTIELSTLAMRHLSLLKRKGNVVITSPPILIRRPIWESEEPGVTRDVEQWLGGMVDLKLTTEANTPWIILGSYPLSQLP